MFDPAFKPIRYTGDREREFFRNGIFLFDVTALDEQIRSHQEDYVLTDIEVDRYYTDDRPCAFVGVTFFCECFGWG